jgi:hypothetical protein
VRTATRLIVGAVLIEVRGAVLARLSARAAPRQSSTKNAATASQRTGMRIRSIYWCEIEDSRCGSR